MDWKLWGDAMWEDGDAVSEDGDSLCLSPSLPSVNAGVETPNTFSKDMDGLSLIGAYKHLTAGVLSPTDPIDSETQSQLADNTGPTSEHVPGALSPVRHPKPFQHSVGQFSFRRPLNRDACTRFDSNEKLKCDSKSTSNTEMNNVTNNGSKSNHPLSASTKSNQQLSASTNSNHQLSASTKSNHELSTSTKSNHELSTSTKSNQQLSTSTKSNHELSTSTKSNQHVSSRNKMSVEQAKRKPTKDRYTPMESDVTAQICPHHNTRQISLFEYEKLPPTRNRIRAESYNSDRRRRVHLDEEEADQFNAFVCMLLCIMGLGLIIGLVILLCQYVEQKEQNQKDTEPADEDCVHLMNTVYHRRVADIIAQTSLHPSPQAPATERCHYESPYLDSIIQANSSRNWWGCYIQLIEDGITVSS